MNPTSIPTPLDHELLEGDQALCRLRPELEALVPPFRPRAIHVPHGVSVLLGAQPTIDQMLPLMARYTPLANASRISRMRDIALATAFVHHRSLPRPLAYPPELRALVADAYSARRRLGKAAKHLAELGLLDARRVEEIRVERGHVGTGDALLALATLFEEHWWKIEHSTPIGRAELRRAAEHGAELLAVATERRERAHRYAKRSDLPRRTVHMMCEAYEEARRVSTYIAWYEPELRPLPSMFRRLARERVVLNGQPSGDGAESMADASEHARLLLAAE
jgi:hypothetical protein